MSIPKTDTYPITEFALESFIQLMLEDPDGKSTKTQMRGVHDFFAGGWIEAGKRYKIDNNDSRYVVHANPYYIVFYRDDEEKLFSQDTIGFSVDIEFSAFAIAGQDSIGAIYFGKIVMGLISAGFAATSLPAFMLIFIGDTAQSVLEVKNDPKSMAILRFVVVFLGVRNVLSRIALNLSKKLFYFLLEQVKGQIKNELDPEGIMKIFVSLITTVVMKKLKINDRVIKSQNRLAKKDIIVMTVLTVAKLIWQVLKVVPASLAGTQKSLERAAISIASTISTNLRQLKVNVSREEIYAIAKELKNPKVLEKLKELQEAAIEVKKQLR